MRSAPILALLLACSGSPEPTPTPVGDDGASGDEGGGSADDGGESGEGTGDGTDSGLQPPDVTWCEAGEEPAWKLTDLAPEAGVQHPHSRGRGIVFADFDGDRWPDLYTANDDDENRLYLNNQDGTFRIAADSPELERYTTSVSAADFDADGDLDLWMGCGGFVALCDNGLFRNEGVVDGEVQWTDVTESSGLATAKAGATFGGSWFDYDNDGDLDLFVVNKDLRETWFNGYPSPEPGDWVDITPPEEPDWEGEDYSYADELWRNEGDGTFTNVADSAGIAGGSNSHQAAILDYDQDGWLDVYVPALFQPNLLWHNQGDGTFVEATPDALKVPIAAFGAQAQDFDQDGRIDILVAVHSDRSMDHEFESDRLFLSLADGSWLDATESTELNRVAKEDIDPGPEDYAGAVMGNQAGDLDGDGYMEMLYGDGGPGAGHGRVNRLWTTRQEGDVLRFRSRTEHIDDEPRWTGEGDKPWIYPFRSHGTGFVDFDRDGDMDLFVSNGGLFGDQREPNQLFRNDSSCRNGFVRVELRGTTSNPHGVGAKVQLADGPEDTRSWVHTLNHDLASGFNSSKETLVTVGAGSDAGPYTLTIHWPLTGTEIYEGIERGAEVVIVEGTGIVDP